MGIWDAGFFTCHVLYKKNMYMQKKIKAKYCVATSQLKDGRLYYQF